MTNTARALSFSMGITSPTNAPEPGFFESSPGRFLKRVGDFATPPFIRRHPANPILTASMIPYPSHLVFNSSVVGFNGRWLMMFRNEWYPEEGNPVGKVAHLGIAESTDGVHWTPRPEAIDLSGVGFVSNNAYDPRALEVDGRHYVTLCEETRHGPQAATLRTEDFRTFTLHDVAPPSTRNFTLFPEKINGLYYRLERPFWQAVDTWCNRFAQWISEPYTIYLCSSPDMVHWGNYRLLFETEMFDFANIKIGPGGAPIRTDEGWLLLLHGVDHDPRRGKNGWQTSWRNRYHGGVALLDLEDPARVIAYNRRPFLTPEVAYETSGGYRNHVIFPMTGLIMKDGLLYIYYGAADTHTCLATTPLRDLLDFCLEGRL